jgi:CubicO group peptidase (beta-lactamase class C family)
MKIIKQMMLVTLVLILAASIAGGQGIPKATRPEEVGLSKERLQRISAWIQSDVDKKVVPGAVVMVLRKGKIAYYEALAIRIEKKTFP